MNGLAPTLGEWNKDSTGRLPIWGLLALFLVALGLRLYRLGAQCFWYDEAQTLFVAQAPWGEIIQRAYRPPLYHYFLHAWSALVPDSEFWLRLPNAVAGALIPPLLALVGARLYGRRVGLVAGLLGCISPTLVAYAQELRMYSLLGLEFALLACLGVDLIRSPARKGPWIGYLLVVIAALYTHYFAIPFLLASALVGWVVLALRQQPGALASWIRLHVVAALAYVPWVAVILSARGGTGDYVQSEVSPILAEVPGVAAFLKRVWLFYTTGPTTSDWPLVHLWAAIAGGVFLLFTLGLLADAVRWLARRPADETHRSAAILDLCLLGLILLPLLLAAVMYHLRPGTVHPRHLMMISVPFLLLVAREGAWAWRKGSGVAGVPAWRLGSVISVVAIAGLLALCLVLYHRDPALQRADVRELTRYVESVTSQGDVILLPYQDYAFDYYYHGPAQSLFLETRVGDEDLLQWLLPQMQGAGRAVLLRWVHTLADPRDALDWFLEANGELQERRWLAERWASVYALEQPVTLPPFVADSVRFGPLSLVAQHIPSAQPAYGTLPIALQWRLGAAASEDLKASVRLVDAAGRVIVAEDRVILGEQVPMGITQWSVGDTAYNYYLLEIPAGTPPVSYTISVTIYGEAGPLIASREGATLGTQVTIADLALQQARVAALPLPNVEGLRMIGADLGGGLWLEAVGVVPDSIGPAEPLVVALYWRAQGPLSPLEPALRLVGQDGAVLAEAAGVPAYGQYPTDRWLPGELVTEYRELRTPAEVEATTARLELEVDGHTIALGDVAIVSRDRDFAPPNPANRSDVQFDAWARLAGADLEPTVPVAGGPLAVTLFWEALGTPQRDFTVFVQLLSPDDRVIAQHDGYPDTGRWPTSTWVSGQTIADRHELTFSDPGYRGPVRLIAGLYDSATMQRLGTDRGGDHAEILQLTLQ